MIAAGPAADILWLSVLLALFQINPNSELAINLLVPAIGRQILMLLTNILPWTRRKHGRAIASDMLAFWRTFWKKGDANAAYRQGYVALLSPYRDLGEPSPRFRRRSDRIAYHLLDAEGCLRPSTEDDLTALERELAFHPSRAERLLILDTLATHLLAGEGSHERARLEQIMEEVTALAPDLPTLKGTRAAVLARTGRHEEALALLAEADESNDFNRCLNAAFRALAHFHAGRAEQAAASFEAADRILQSHDWSGWVGERIVERVRREIGHQAATPMAIGAGN